MIHVIILSIWLISYYWHRGAYHNHVPAWAMYHVKWTRQGDRLTWQFIWINWFQGLQLIALLFLVISHRVIFLYVLQAAILMLPQSSRCSRFHEPIKTGSHLIRQNAPRVIISEVFPFITDGTFCFKQGFSLSLASKFIDHMKLFHKIMWYFPTPLEVLWPQPLRENGFGV